MVSRHRAHRSAQLRLLIGALATAIAVGCGGRDSTEKREPAPQPTTDERRALSLKKVTATRQRKDFQKPPALPKLEPVTLLDAGAEPRQALRYRLDDKAHEFTIAVRTKTREFRGGAWTEPVELPEATIGLGVERTGADNALWVVDIRGLSAKIGASSGDSASARAALDDFLARYRSFLERRRAQLPLTDRGRPGTPILTPDARMSEDAGHISAEMTQLLLESLIPLPEEPVGKGARWRAVSLLYRGRSAVKQTAEYELRSAPSGRMRLGVRITQIGEHQTLDASGLAPGQHAELVALFWQVAGELELDTTMPTPVAGTLSLEMRLHGRMVMPQGTQDYSLESTGQSLLRTASSE